MPCLDLFALLKRRPYPGRGIVIGRSEDGQTALAAYFLMGRSPNSRNRVLSEKGGNVITEAADPARMQDPSLVIYTAIRRRGTQLVVSNGDQTDTIYSCLERDIPFEESLRTRTFEPDAPNYTPRISALLNVGLSGFGYQLSIIKTAEGDPASVQRFFFEYPQPLPGEGHFIHTYAEAPAGAAALPSFGGEPLRVALPGGLAEFGDALWAALDADNKISLVVKALRLDGSEETKIYNKYTTA